MSKEQTFLVSYIRSSISNLSLLSGRTQVPRDTLERINRSSITCPVALLSDIRQYLVSKINLTKPLPSALDFLCVQVGPLCPGYQQLPKMEERDRIQISNIKRKAQNVHCNSVIVQAYVYFKCLCFLLPLVLGIQGNLHHPVEENTFTLSVIV